MTRIVGAWTSSGGKGASVSARTRACSRSSPPSVASRRRAAR
ncbi:hypothetical protein NKH77_48530 [Streptomyces sp. M19]